MRSLLHLTQLVEALMVDEIIITPTQLVEALMVDEISIQPYPASWSIDGWWDIFTASSSYLKHSWLMRSRYSLTQLVDALMADDIIITASPS